MKTQLSKTAKPEISSSILRKRKQIKSKRPLAEWLSSQFMQVNQLSFVRSAAERLIIISVAKNARQSPTERGRQIMTKSSSNSSENSSKWRGWNNNSRWVKRRNERKGKTFQSAANQWKLLRITVNSKAHFPRWARLCWWSPFYFKVQVRKIMLHHFIRLRHIWNHLPSNHESICEGLVCRQNVKLYIDFVSFFLRKGQIFFETVRTAKIKVSGN